MNLIHKQSPKQQSSKWSNVLKGECHIDCFLRLPKHSALTVLSTEIGSQLIMQFKQKRPKMWGDNSWIWQYAPTHPVRITLNYLIVNIS